MRLFKKREKEQRSEQSGGNALLEAILNPTEITKEKAMQIPSVSGSISLIANVIASTPIKLYQDFKDTDGNMETKEITEDNRVNLLNNSTGDTLNNSELWRALIQDYFLGKGGYIYINKRSNEVKSLHYVDESFMSFTDYVNPIFKDYDVYVNGVKYYPFDFIKILRNTKNGAYGRSIIQENYILLSVAYNSLIFEENLVKKGGNKKGFLESENKLEEEAIKQLRENWNRLYANNSDNVAVLNNGVKFKESSNTSVEMQLNQNKITNAEEIGKLFQVSPSLLNGTSQSIKPTEEIRKFIKLAVIPIMKIIESALNEDLLLEKEKRSFYFAFDTKELLKGDMLERFQAYKEGIDGKFITIDEVRYAENLKALGLDFINLGLDAVLYNTNTKEIFVANTGEKANMDKLKEGGTSEN